MCAKTADGVSLTEVKTIKSTDYDGVRETIEYELWCKSHNPVSRQVPCNRSINHNSRLNYSLDITPRRVSLQLAERQKLQRKISYILNSRPSDLAPLFLTISQPARMGVHQSKGM